MTGITPPEFTFSGRCVDWPPIILRPTMRLAYCTGIRRSRALDVDDEGDDRDHADDQQDQSSGTVKAPQACVADLLVEVRDAARQADDDAGEDQQLHAVADAALGNLLTQPHDEAGAGGQSKNAERRRKQRPGW